MRPCALLLLALACGTAQALTVCADPNNLPFSNRAEQGFENKLVQILAGELHSRVRYVWWAQRRGFARHTLTDVRCDLWPGVPAGLASMATSQPYYASSYMYVSRADRGLRDLSLDDERLRRLVIGVQLVGDDAMNTPPAHALAARGLIENVRGFTLYGDYSQPNPPAAIVDAVTRATVDVALVWGPLAGYFAARSPLPLHLQPLEAAVHGWPMRYEIAVGVRRSDAQLLRRVNAALSRQRHAIDRLLRAYHVPRTDLGFELELPAALPVRTEITRKETLHADQ
jgi:mxaJ protein